MRSFDLVWDEIHSTQEWGKYPSEHVIRFMARNYYKMERQNVRVLDFCCGGGAHTWYLAREGFDVYAFDGSKYAIEKVKKLLQKDALRAHLDVHDALETNYSDGFFDVVIDNVSVYANIIANIEAMYKDIYRMLAVGGKLFTTVFTADTTGADSGTMIESDTYRDLQVGNLAGRGIVHFFTPESISKLLNEIGFKSLVIDTMRYTDCGQVVSMLLVQGTK